VEKGEDGVEEGSCPGITVDCIYADVGHPEKFLDGCTLCLGKHRQKASTVRE